MTNQYFNTAVETAQAWSMSPDGEPLCFIASTSVGGALQTHVFTEERLATYPAELAALMAQQFSATKNTSGWHEVSGASVRNLFAHTNGMPFFLPPQALAQHTRRSSTPGCYISKFVDMDVTVNTTGYDPAQTDPCVYLQYEVHVVEELVPGCSRITPSFCGPIRRWEVISQNWLDQAFPQWRERMAIAQSLDLTGESVIHHVLFGVSDKARTVGMTDNATMTLGGTFC